ncbi:hypothetical protein H9L15_08510 [Sphingomonas daechungensis]|uniref:Uncharacterized protein n=1 Tax=Sphingomonas daechungensis TaxID=1176646 RepID=A0ABX6T3X8_9SPHN|nr:hypothetical protein [Sphingomonas daechungensis]QNP42363.1 hypothetical protein H9L15_08510 [Sphingomonas daechungensis]
MSMMYLERQLQLRVNWYVPPPPVLGDPTADGDRRADPAARVMTMRQSSPAISQARMPARKLSSTMTLSLVP